MENIDELLLAIKAEADDGNTDCQKLLHYHWKTPEDILKAILVLYTACRIDEKMPNIFKTSAEEVISMVENQTWDDALWQLYPTVMETLAREDLCQ
jgi:hypothetical protein